MKTFKIIAKIVAALAAVAGAVYVIAAYGEKIEAWAKKTLGSCPLCRHKGEEDEVFEDEEDIFEDEQEVPAEEEAADKPAEEPAEETAEEPAAEDEAVASDEDFEG